MYFYIFIFANAKKSRTLAAKRNAAISDCFLAVKKCVRMLECVGRHNRVSLTSQDVTAVRFNTTLEIERFI